MLRRNGAWFPAAKDRWPTASSVVKRVEALTGDGGEHAWMPKGAAEFSAIAPGSELRRHCGPSNHRLRLHLGLQVPTNGAAIEVAGEARSWVEGKVLVIDDSFEHRVRQDSHDFLATPLFKVREIEGEREREREREREEEEVRDCTTCLLFSSVLRE